MKYFQKNPGFSGTSGILCRGLFVMLKCSLVKKCLDEFMEEKSLGVSKFKDTTSGSGYF